jgi:hypothetical protein
MPVAGSANSDAPRPERRARSLFVAGLRALLFLVLAFMWREPPPVPVELGPQQTVVTRHPKVGVHTRLTDEVEAWKIKQTLALVREMGAPWIVEYFPWAYYEPAQGQFNWDHPDLVVNHARRQGLNVIARIDYVPDWARPKNTTPRFLDEANFPDYAAFVAAFATHFRGRVNHIVVWNEPNLSFEWGYRPVDPAAYTRLLRLTHATVKAVAPEVQVLAAGLAPTLALPGSADGMDDLIFLQRMYDAGARDAFDGLAIHAYGWKFPPDEPPAPDAVNFRRVELLRQVMVRNGDAAKPAYITEGGWNDHPRWTKAVRPAQRIEYTLAAYRLAESWDWCQAIALWAFRFPWPNQTFQDYFSFVTVDFVPKPIYDEVRAYTTTNDE